ncbi:MAG: DUF1549 domain-containing protein, partial [Gemmataceae bacterium]|nr:DUF1549 domain-containing protein [Gemmataceae bacterium]
MRHTAGFAMLLCGFCFVLVAGAGFAADKAATSDQVRFFETHVRPVLAEYCFGCHGPEKPKSGLRLDSRAGLLQGGASGEPAIVPGQPEKSRLLQAVGGQDAHLKMPPKGQLAQRQVVDLTRWVQMGAPWPATARAPKAPPGEAAVQHWSFQPPVDRPVPTVRNKTWASNALDCFILAQLEANGLHPAPPADKRTLLRRATFDLTGLPPTPEEIDAFLADDAAHAFAKVVDRLLAAPAYGERWGRHWLDVARYADSNGLDENVAHGNAWRYRDYVVAAFNQDKPYDQFLLEQLAGDLLPPHPTLSPSGGEGRVRGADEATRYERLIATGFLALGPKVLAEVDEQKMEMDIVDEQIDTVGRAFLGLTLGCARCHDHKFDPLSTEDYYALAGIFKSTRTMEHFKKVARWWENALVPPAEQARRAAHDALMARQQETIKNLVKKANEQVKATAKASPTAAKDLEGSYPEEIKKELKSL